IAPPAWRHPTGSGAWRLPSIGSEEVRSHPEAIPQAEYVSTGWKTREPPPARLLPLPLLGPDGSGADEKLIRFSFAVLQPEQASEVSQGRRDERVVRPQGLFADREGLPQERLGLRILLEVDLRVGQVDVRLRQERVIGR